MAKTTVTAAVLLLLFAVAQARFSLDLEKKAVEEPETVVETVPETVLPESNSKSGGTNNFLLLPSEKPETETEIEAEFDTSGLIGFDLEAADDKLTEPETSEGESATVQSSTVEVIEPEESESRSGADSNSVTVISFRPMNQHFKRLPFPFRRGHRCHHHHHQGQHGHMFRMEEGPRGQGRERGYGNDMILSEEGMKFETELHDRQRMVPGRLMRFRNGDGMRMHHHRFGRHEEMHHEHEREYRDDDREDHEREHHEHDHHEHDHHEHDHYEHDRHEHDHHEHEHHEHGNGFMRKIRKFLTNF